jgi:acyl carrier protein
MSSTRLSSRSDPNDVAHALTAFINASIMARGRPVQPDDDLESAGLDSMALLKVLIFIEAEFGFWMPDEDLVAENIASPTALAHYICRVRNASC